MCSSCLLCLIRVLQLRRLVRLLCLLRLRRLLRCFNRFACVIDSRASITLIVLFALRMVIASCWPIDFRALLVMLVSLCMLGPPPRRKSWWVWLGVQGRGVRIPMPPRIRLTHFGNARNRLSHFDKYQNPYVLRLQAHGGELAVAFKELLHPQGYAQGPFPRIAIEIHP